jgi:membrane protein YdbS with pleckstrin-like domain
MNDILHKINTVRKRYRPILFAFVILISLNYNPQLNFEINYQHWGWNLSLLATILTLLIFRFRDPKDWKQKLGIDFRHKDWIGFFITTAAILIISFYLVDYLSNANGFDFKPKILHYSDYFSPTARFFSILGEYLYYIPETFNEEIFIGAFLLLGLERNFKKLDSNIIAIGIALLFCFMHQAMYKWSPVQSGILLSTQTIMTLFFVGVLRNALILKTRKIAYSWAIHLSFNMIFFPGFFINQSTEKFANEPERFNIVFGNLTMVLITGLLAVISLIWLNINRLRK